MAGSNRQRRILISALVGGVLVILPWLAFMRPIIPPLDQIAFLLIWAGIVIIGISIAELITFLFSRGRKKDLVAILALVSGLLLLVILQWASSFLSEIEIWSYFWPLNKFLAFISGGYLLIVGWTLVANSISDSSRRSRHLLGCSLANYLISFVILILLAGQNIHAADWLLLIIILAVVSTSLAWSSVFEVDENDVSSHKGTKAERAFQASMLTLIPPLALGLWLLSTMYFT